MKKISIMCLIISMLFITSTVYAGTAYVDSINIDAKINTDGSMTVTENIYWDIEDSLNGLYRDILIENKSNELNSASDILVSEVFVDGLRFYYSPTTLQNGDNGKYNINEIDGGKQIKIFTPSLNEMKTTSITYTLRDVIVKYNDIAELYWNFIGSGWEYGIDNVSIKITVPGLPKTLKVFGHGPLNGYSEITESNTVTLVVNDLRSKEQVDARVLLDNTLVSPKKVVEQNKLESILTEEAKLAEQANFKRELAKRTFVISILLVIAGLLIPIFVYISVRKRAYKAKFDGKYCRELPEDYGPAIMNRLLHPANSTANTHDMLATLLDLVRRKYVEISPVIKEGKKKPTDYLLKLINTDLSELNESEVHYIKQLIFLSETQVSLNELRKRNSVSVSSQERAHKAYIRWGEILTSIAKNKMLLKTEKLGMGKSVLKCILGFIVIIAVVVYGFMSNYEDIIGIGMVGAFIGLFELIIVILKIHDLTVRTEKGVEHMAMWKAFKQFLLDFSKLDEHDYKSIAIWEHYLVYATALGISKQVIKELKIIFPTEFEDSRDMFTRYATISLLSDSDAFSNFSNSFNAVAATAFSTQSSTNGSGGGFSGGAGGGRRWRRRRRLLVSKENNMGSYIMHMGVSEIVKKKLKLTDKFILGSILPDNLKSITGDRDSTHYIQKTIVDGEERKLPNITEALNKLDIQDEEIKWGYIAHLVEDLVWFNKYIPTYAKDLGNNKIKYLVDGSIHTADEFRNDIYSDYMNSGSYIVSKCKMDVPSLVTSLNNLTQDKSQMKIILENTKCLETADIYNNKFMNKDSIDSYIECCANEVEKVIVQLMKE